MPLQLRRLRITAGAHVAFDQRFEAGVNVIDGENASGKSTLFKLLYHGLGGTIAPPLWTDAALRCDQVIVELGVGEGLLTTIRRVESRPSLPVLVCPGSMDDALANRTIEDWSEYPYARSENKQSFSQLIFSLLGWVEAYSESGDFITLNQFLRAHYADQESPATSVIRYEDNFDKTTTRESIGNFLLGGNDPQLANLERQLRDLESEYAKTSGATSAGVQLIGGEFDALNLPAIQQQRENFETELAVLEGFTRALMDQALQPITAKDVDRDVLRDISRRISELKRQLSDRRDAAAQLRFEIQDSDLFIATLSNRIRYLTEASTAAGEFGLIPLDFCPACGTGVTDDGDPESCYLCKSAIGEEPAERRLFSMVNASQSQIEQSLRLQKNRRTNLDKIHKEIASLERDLDASAADLEQQQASVVSSAQAELASSQTRIGFIRSELARLRRDESIIQRLQDLRDKRDAISKQILALREEIDSTRLRSSARVGSAYARVSAEALKFLRSDFERQLGFREADSVEIDYRHNRFHLSGAQSLSASSTAYLRNAIFLGELFAENSLPSMRHLGVLLLENLEDKGMEPARYYNLHKNIVERAAELNGTRQIIIATADWNPDIEGGFHRIGPRYTHENPTLDLPPTL